MFIDKPGVGAGNMQVETGGKRDFFNVANDMTDIARSIKVLDQKT